MKHVLILLNNRYIFKSNRGILQVNGKYFAVMNVIERPFNSYCIKKG